MLSNIIEFKDFLDYYYNILNASIQNKENIKVFFSHKNNTLTLKFISDSGYSIDTFNCSNEFYNEIIKLLYSSFISTNKIIIASKNKNTYKVKSEKIEIISEIDDELANKISTQAFAKMKSKNEDQNRIKTLSEFEKVSNFFRVYSNYLKRCEKKENPSSIKINYNNGLYSITITNNGETVFSRNILCSNFKAKRLNNIICENMIDENSIILSSITANNHIKIQTPKFCLFMPYDNNLEKYHNEALEKMNEYNLTYSKQKIKSSNR